MAVAVKGTSEIRPQESSSGRLPMISLAGAGYVVIAIAAVVFGVPRLWHSGVSPWLVPALGSFVDVAGLFVVVLTCAAALIALGLAIAGQNPPQGTRAGVFTVLAGTILILLVSLRIGTMLERYVFFNDQNMIGRQVIGMIGSESTRLLVGASLTAVIGLVLLGAALVQFRRPEFQAFLPSFEYQGWFRARSYKASQGLRVRRLTLLGVWILLGSGVYSLIANDTLRSANKNWSLTLPFSSGQSLTLLPDIAITVPLLLIALSAWIGWRIVNFPAFADFLIATEAELNKVSWTTRKRLIQDTIVVLVTVLLFSLFLLVVDQAWGWALTRDIPFVGRIVPKPAPADPATVAREVEW